jgi:hypothetical protein
MKKIIFSLAIIFFVINNIHSQENSKRISLKVKDLKTIQKDGKTSWTVKTILTNHSHDTLFYISSTDCEPAYYSVGADIDSIQLLSNFKECHQPQRTVIAIPPSGKRTVNLEISSVKPVTSSFKLIVYLITGKAKNIDERISDHELFRKERRMLVVSNRIKIRMPT